MTGYYFDNLSKQLLKFYNCFCLFSNTSIEECSQEAIQEDKNQKSEELN